MQLIARHAEAVAATLGDNTIENAARSEQRTPAHTFHLAPELNVRLNRALRSKRKKNAKNTEYPFIAVFTRSTL